MIKAVFFDLDGTLLPMDEEEFTKVYFNEMANKMSAYGYDKKQLIDVIWNGTKAMYLNDGSKSNEQVFWEYFDSIYGQGKSVDKAIFDSFYTNEFKKTIACCGKNTLAKEIVKFCKDNFQYVVLSTNPIFPLIGTKTRMSYVDLKEEDFDFVTAYENSRFCKPNPKYFLDLLNNFNLKPEEVIIFGNNDYEDGECANSLNIKCYLVRGNIIYNPKAIHTFEEINMEDIIEVLKKHCQ